MIRALLLPLALVLSLYSHAKEPLISDGKPPKPYSLSEFNWLDRQHMDSQRDKIDSLGRSKLGQPVRGTKDDLELLQRIIYKGLIKQDDVQTMQALGAVMGDVMVKEFNLSWMVLEDDLGRSRAVCEPVSEECLFPITMLSRRMEVGLLPNVQELYDYSFELIEPHLPKLPYSE